MNKDSYRRFRSSCWHVFYKKGKFCYEKNCKIQREKPAMGPCFSNVASRLTTLLKITPSHLFYYECYETFLNSFLIGSLRANVSPLKLPFHFIYRGIWNRHFLAKLFHTSSTRINFL